MWLKICSLSNVQVYTTGVVKYSPHAVHQIPRTYSFYNWKFVAFDKHLPFSSTPSPWKPAFYSLFLHLGLLDPIWKWCAMLSRFSCVWLSVTPWAVAHQAPLSMGILQARIQGWVAMPSSRGSSDPGLPPVSLSPELAGGFFTTSATWGASI